MDSQCTSFLWCTTRCVVVQSSSLPRSESAISVLLVPKISQMPSGVQALAKANVEGMGRGRESDQTLRDCSATGWVHD